MTDIHRAPPFRLQKMMMRWQQWHYDDDDSKDSSNRYPPCSSRPPPPRPAPQSRRLSNEIKFTPSFLTTSLNYMPPWMTMPPNSPIQSCFRFPHFSSKAPQTTSCLEWQCRPNSIVFFFSSFFLTCSSSPPLAHILEVRLLVHARSSWSEKQVFNFSLFLILSSKMSVLVLTQFSTT